MGRSLMPRLDALGEPVVLLGRHPPTPGQGARTYLHWDLDDPAVPSLPRSAVIVHLAAYIPADHHALDEAEACLRRNALATLRLLVAADACGATRFVHVSTGNLYGPGRQPAREEDQLMPQAASAYLTSKLAAEAYVASVASSLPRTVLRPSSIYGPGMSSGVVLAFAQRLRRSERVEVRDGGAHTSDFVHVDDVAAAVVAAAVGRVDGAVNVGSGRLVSTLQVARTMAEIAGRPDLVEVTGPPARPGGFRSLDVSRLRTELGIEPRGLEAGLRALLDGAA